MNKAMCRKATIADAEAIEAFLKKYHETESNLQSVEYKKKDMLGVIYHHIQSSDSCAFVSILEGTVVGVVLGALDCYVFNKGAKWATDTLFIAKRGGRELLGLLKEWAKVKKATHLFLGNSSGRIEADRMYQSEGMPLVGGMYKLDLKVVEKVQNK